MQIVIDIDDEAYDVLMGKQDFANIDLFSTLIQAVQLGTPLPKGHGDLIDRNEIEYMKAIHDLVWDKITSSECATKIKYSAPTIIEAESEEE